MTTPKKSRPKLGKLRKDPASTGFAYDSGLALKESLAAPAAPAGLEAPALVHTDAEAVAKEFAYNGYRAVQNLGRSLVAEATSQIDRDPDRAIAMTNTYIALVTLDGRARV